MLMLSVLLVVGSGLMNALWNLFAKKSGHKGVFLGLIMSTATVVLLPHLVWELSTRALPVQGYLLLLGSMSIQIFYALLLSKAYRSGELSKMYPIMRGTGVVLVPLAGVLLLGERISVWGWLGIVCVVGGLLLTGFWASGHSARADERSLVWAFSVGLSITSYTVVDKLTLQYISPLSLLQVSSMGFMLAHMMDILNTKWVREEWSLNWRLILLGSLLSPGSYLLFLLAMDAAPISHLAPMREIGTVFATLFGTLFLKEKQGWTRLATASVITAGIIVIGING